MRITMDGRAVGVDEGATLDDVVSDLPHAEGCHVAVVRSIEQVKKETKEFEVVTEQGSMVLSLNDSPYAEIAREIFKDLSGKRIRWQTSKILAIGSFPTDIEVRRGENRYARHECFFALGGYDSSTTYFMVAKQDHEADYGVDGGVFGRITRGRHLLGKLQETEVIEGIRPIVLETTTRDAFATDDLSTVLEEGVSLETYVGVKLNDNSPISSEHFLVTASRGRICITDKTATFSATSDNMDVSLLGEEVGVREEGTVTVRHDGAGMGRVYFYHRRRQLSTSHSITGWVVAGSNLVRTAPRGALVAVRSDPSRVMTIGMTQAEGELMLDSSGIRQVRTGETGDDAIIVEQEPELTMEVIHIDEVETLGVRPDQIHEIELRKEGSPKSVSYIRKITGLDHKPVGTLKVHFTFPDLPMVTFEGNERAAGTLVPEKPFEETAKRGDMAVTNMSRPQKGLVGLRLEDSDEFGPTGEERYGTNMVGRMVGDIDKMMEDLKEGDIVYIRERKEEENEQGE